MTWAIVNKDPHKWADEVLATGIQRSAAYRRGMVFILKMKQELSEIAKLYDLKGYCPYPIGTAKADAWFAGCDRGQSVFNEYQFLLGYRPSAMQIIEKAEADLGSDLGGSVTDLLLDNLDISRADALFLIKGILSERPLPLCATEWNDLFAAGQPVEFKGTKTRTSGIARNDQDGNPVVPLAGSKEMLASTVKLRHIRPIMEAQPS